MEKPEGAPHPRLLLWTLLVVYIFNFIDRQIVSILAEPIARDLDLSDSQLGLLTGLAFALFYATLGVPIARVADNGRTNRSRLIAVCVAVWSAMTALCGGGAEFLAIAAGAYRRWCGGGRLHAHRPRADC